MTRVIAATAVLMIVSLAAAGPEEVPFTVPLQQRQLFVDDYGVARIEKLKRTMHQPAKKGAVIRPEWQREQSTPQIRCAPCWDADAEVFKLPVTGPIGDTSVTTIWESEDGLHWRRAAVSEKQFYSVVCDPTDPDPSRRYKSMHHTGKGLVPMVSPDMVTWKAVEAAPIPSSDEWNLSVDTEEHLFICTLKRGGPYGRAVYLATSTDFEKWTDHGLVFHADDLDQELGRSNIEARLADPRLQQPSYHEPSAYNVDVYNMGVFRYEGLYVGMPALYHATGPIPNYPNTDGFHLVQLTCSRDLKTWHRLGDREAFIAPSPRGAGAYDLTQIIGPSDAVVRGDELWFYYTGIKYRASWEYVGEYPHGEHVPLPGLDPDQGAICLAVLRRDGFISLDADDETGAVVTKPFTVSGSKLFVNVDARGGELGVEVLDEDGQVAAVSEPVTDDLPRAEVKWKHGHVAHMSGKTASLRFSLRNASLYSYWLE